MIVPYTELPEEAGGWPRPLLDVVIADMEDMRVPCLVDSGALNTLLPGWVADAGGISRNDLKSRPLAVAATSTEAAFLSTRLNAADHSWEAELGFCRPWPYGWGLLGQLSFFRFFTVIFRAADFEFEVEAI
ncbi:MAG: hypothetical protein M3N51_05120 [Actinomycetota bacterium]|nr:hypothetical protein [Actinomycetota bacterium]